MIENEYKRQTRKMSDATKQKISQKLKGRMKSQQVCDKISSAMKNYWSTIKD